MTSADLILSFDKYQTLAIAVVAVLVGYIIKKKLTFLDRFCIPAPVIGGLAVALIICILHVTQVTDVEFDASLQEVCMVFFFTSVGFHADINFFRTDGKGLLKFMILVLVLVVLQNTFAIGGAMVLGMDGLLGLCTGSIPMTGGHGTSAAFGPVIEGRGLANASTICIACATYGLVAGSVIGGPVANALIIRKNLQDTAEEPDEYGKGSKLVRVKRDITTGYSVAAFQMAIAAGIGTAISMLLSKTGVTFPVYIGAMLSAAVIRNIGELTGKIDINMDHISDIGEIMLPLFLGVAMITMRIYDLFALALPLTVLLLVQTVLMAVFARYVVFNVMGRDYDAAVIAAGFCGFGMGATPNAMANMQTICAKYRHSYKAFLLVPIAGSVFADFINSSVITLFLNII